jgi:hypothetical protein
VIDGDKGKILALFARILKAFPIKANVSPVFGESPVGSEAGGHS